VAGVVAERIDRALDLEAFGALDKAAPIRAAAEFAVICDLQAGAFLQLDDVADAIVLDLRERLIRNAAVLMLLEGLTERGWPQQAADMIGTERRTA
jgi:hypothetical protein